VWLGESGISGDGGSEESEKRTLRGGEGDSIDCMPPPAELKLLPYCSMW
jgi:hypothetical protein